MLNVDVMADPVNGYTGVAQSQCQRVRQRQPAQCLLAFAEFIGRRTYLDLASGKAETLCRTEATRRLSAQNDGIGASVASRMYSPICRNERVASGTTGAAS